MHVKNIMTREVISLRPNDTLKRALATLSENNISAAPVINQEDEVIGIISESDIFECFEDCVPTQTIDRHLGVTFDMLEIVRNIIDAQKMFPSSKVKKFLKKKISEIMTDDVVTLSPGNSLVKASKIMAEMDINHVPVTEKSKLIGIVSRADLIVGLSQGG